MWEKWQSYCVFPGPLIDVLVSDEDNDDGADVAVVVNDDNKAATGTNILRNYFHAMQQADGYCTQSRS